MATKNKQMEVGKTYYTSKGVPVRCLYKSKNNKMLCVLEREISSFSTWYCPDGRCADIPGYDVDWNYRDTCFCTLGDDTPITNGIDFRAAPRGLLRCQTIMELQEKLNDPELSIHPFDRYRYLSEWDNNTGELIRVFLNPEFNE